LTELDDNFSSELLVACHDDDDRNRKLALAIWEENGLDVPENSVKFLLPYLCTPTGRSYASAKCTTDEYLWPAHNSLHVRSSAARAIAYSISLTPAEVSAAIAALSTFYREKVRIGLAPYSARLVC
jgi:hypothetical protein